MTSMSPINTAAAMSAPSSHGGSVSPRQSATPKNVAFELLFRDSPQYRARLPMRVQIYPHDTTESIVTTVKNFYGLYSGPTGSKGVSFEDDQGHTLIARYENFANNMVVYVRVSEESPATVNDVAPAPLQGSPIAAEPLYEGGQYPPQSHNDQDSSRSPRRRSRSPVGDSRIRSDSTGTNGKKARSRSSKGKPSIFNGQDGYESMNGYSSGDGDHGSVSSRSKEQLGNTDISLENIVEGGRRKRAKFESSELPLFAPPQMPAATSNPSVSPARRIEHHRQPVGFGQQSHNPFTNPRAIHSSQYYNTGVYVTPSSEDRRHRGSISYGAGAGILPTPDPTVGSCMSEEDKDVAIQLMRLGEMSNISHGRTSASTLDDTFSGKADAASSTGATSDGESDSDEELPPARRQRLDGAGFAKSIYPTTEVGSSFMTSSADHVEYSSEEEYDHDSVAKQQKSKPKPKAASSKASSVKSHKHSNSVKTKKLPPMAAGPMSPASAPHSRKQSTASVANMGTNGDDEHPDLSTKPRCQRCRKSKKGCDRQRPCGRCRDAGLSADQCISEDEGNGRKGRYGRHMGVPIKQEEISLTSQTSLLPPAPIAPSIAAAVDKSKKRKR